MTTLHAGGKFDSQGLRDLGRPARRRRVGRQRAVRDRSRSRSRAARQLYRQVFSRGVPQGEARRPSARVHNRRGTKVRFKPDAQIFGKDAAFRAGAACSRWRARRPICSAASRSAGNARPRCSTATDTSRPRRCSSFPDGLKDYLATTSRARSSVADQIFAGKIDEARRPRLARMGGRLDGRRRRLSPVLLQHRADARGRHARERACAPR